MFCPNCGNDCADAMFCSECGSAVFLTEDADKPVLSMGRYEGIDGYIELSYYTVKIHKSNGTTPTESILVYDDITDISYQEPSNVGIGYLAIRHVDQSGKPVRSEEDAACDEAALLFTEEQSSVFKDIYVCLRSFLAKHFAKKVDDEMDILWNEGKITMDVIEEWGKNICVHHTNETNRS